MDRLGKSNVKPFIESFGVWRDPCRSNTTDSPTFRTRAINYLLFSIRDSTAIHCFCRVRTEIVVKDCRSITSAADLCPHNRVPPLAELAKFIANCSLHLRPLMILGIYKIRFNNFSAVYTWTTGKTINYLIVCKNTYTRPRIVRLIRSLIPSVLEWKLKKY